VLVYSIAGLVATFGTSFTPFQRNVLTAFLVGFPVVILGVFAWLVSRHSGKLFAPSDYRDDANYLQAVQAVRAAAVTAVTAAEKLPEPGTTQAHVQLTIATAELKTLPAEDAEGTDIEMTPRDKILTPQADWKRDDYGWAYLFTIRSEPEKAEAISDAYLRTEEAGEDNNAAIWNAYRLRVLVAHTNENNLSNFHQLRQLAESNPLIAEVQEQLANGYIHYGDFETATAIFQRAASHTVDTEERSRRLGRAAVSAAKAGHLAQAEQIIDEIKKGFSSDELDEEHLIRSISEVAETIQDDDTLIAVGERTVADNPSASDARFSLAFKHCARGNDDMALIHYLRIPPQERSAATWNNLGVEFNHFRLRAKAVEAFKAAEKMGETLAVANLADTLIGAGFIDEARERCVSAMKAENPHNNVSEALTRLHDVTEEEDKTLAGITQKTRQAVEFYKELGKAIFLSNVDALDEVWNGPQCELRVNLEGTHFTALGSYESLPNALARPIAMTFEPDRFTIEYQGRIKGRSISGTVSRKHLNPPPPSLLSFSRDEPVPFRMLVGDSARQIKVMEGQGNNRRFYVWTAEDFLPQLR
jgi:tetratricopeptide (TPR) repeat protein